MRPAVTLMGMLGALGAFAAAAPAGQAAGFGPVRSVSPTSEQAEMPTAAVTPRGETAVMWRRFGSRSRDFQYMASVGRDAGHLRQPEIVQAGRRAAGSGGEATLLARPGGGFAACFGDLARRGTTVIGCSFSTATGHFGPMRVVERRSARERPSYRAAMRPDGKVAMVLSHRVSGGRQQLRSTTLSSRGGRGPLRSLATLGREASFSLAAVDDGTTAVAWATPQGPDPLASWAVSLRLTAPGKSVFGPPQTFLEGGVARAREPVRLQGGRELMVFVADPADPLAGDVIVRRFPDGSFSGPLRFPRPAAGALGGSVVTPADRSPLAVSVATRVAGNDCANIRTGVIGSGPLVSGAGPSRTAVQRLSKPGQIALYPAAATLADGTVIASWQNAAGPRGEARMEVAIRSARGSAFRASQVLPRLAGRRDSALAAGGDQAVLAWLVGDLVRGPSYVVVSSLRKSPPYAAPAQLPKRPRTPCG